MQASEWHALNGLALYRTQQLKEAIAELKTAFRLKQSARDKPVARLDSARLLMTLGNLYADLSLPREAETYYREALQQMVQLDEPNSQTIIKANMARLYIDTDRPTQARQLLDSLLATPIWRRITAPSSSAIRPWRSTPRVTGRQPCAVWTKRRHSISSWDIRMRGNACSRHGSRHCRAGERYSWRCNC